MLTLVSTGTLAFSQNQLFFCNSMHNVPFCLTVDKFQAELFYWDQGEFDLSCQVPSQIHNKIT